jgi:hypothetical protein
MTSQDQDLSPGQATRSQTAAANLLVGKDSVLETVPGRPLVTRILLIVDFSQFARTSHSSLAPYRHRDCAVWKSLELRNEHFDSSANFNRFSIREPETDYLPS